MSTAGAPTTRRWNVLALVAAGLAVLARLNDLTVTIGAYLLPVALLEPYNAVAFTVGFVLNIAAIVCGGLALRRGLPWRALAAAAIGVAGWAAVAGLLSQATFLLLGFSR